MIGGVLRQVQEESREWRAHNFPGTTDWDQFLGMVEEIGELSHALLKHKQGIRGFEDYDKFMDSVEDSVADLLIFLTGFANECNFDLEDCLSSVWKEVRVRDFIKYPGKGVPPGWGVQDALGGIGVGPTNELDKAADELD